MSHQAPATQSDQTAVIAFLADPSSHAAVAQVDRCQTHGNLIFLAGAEAWKIKRAVRFPYMDFSTLEKRRIACAREVEVNRRFAPGIYLGVVPITRGSDGGLAFGGDGEIVEWTVHMRRFEQSALLSSIAASEGISQALAKAVADVVYDSHQGAQRQAAPTGAERMRRLLESVGSTLAGLDAFAGEDVVSFSRLAEARLAKAVAILEERARSGLVRRCHGDLHLANIVMWHGRPVLYDAIEFDEAIATIDTLYDLAFLLMDLDWHGQRCAANVILNRCLWRGNSDLELRGLVALPLFLALRAAIRAMVTAERAVQEGQEDAQLSRRRARDYLRAALGYLAPPLPQLMGIGGLSGTGKSTLGAALAPDVGAAPGAVHLRSDLERKALFGLGELDRLPAEAYKSDASRKVYENLQRKARLALAAGHSVIVDAVFAEPGERQGIEAVAAGLGVPFHGVWLQADSGQLVARVTARRGDASDATAEVVQLQLSSDVGSLSPAWRTFEAGGPAEETLRIVSSALGIGTAKLETGR